MSLQYQEVFLGSEEAQLAIINSVVSEGGGDSVYDVIDLSGTSSITDSILTIPGGGIVQIGPVFTRPFMVKLSAKWSSRLNSSPYVYVTFREDTGDPLDFQGYSGRFKWTGSIGWATQTGTIASPTQTNSGTTRTISATINDDEWVRFMFQSVYGQGTSGYTSVYISIDDDNGVFYNQATSAPNFVNDWSGASVAEPTASVCIRNDSTDAIDIDLNEVYVYTYADTRA